MKRALTVGLIWMTGSFATASWVGPLGQTAALVEQSAVLITTDVIFGTGEIQTRFVGMRGTYGLSKRLLISLDVGCELEGEELGGYHIEGYDFEKRMVGVGVAAQYSLAELPLPVDIAVRAAVGLYAMDEDLSALDLRLVMSRDISFDRGVTLYGSVGGYLWGGSSHKNPDERVRAVGIQYDPPKMDTSFFCELTYVDHPLVALGVSYGF